MLSAIAVSQCVTDVQRRGMARIQRTHHPIFQGSLETSTFSPIDGAAAPEVSPSPAAPAPTTGPSADAAAQVTRIGPVVEGCAVMRTLEQCWSYTLGY